LFDSSDHEVLDQLLGAVFSIQLQTREDVSVENRFRLDRLKAERAVLMPQFYKPLCDAILKAEVLVEAWNIERSPWRRLLTVQPCRDASVSQFPR
jgi:hypothetical protein